MVKVVAYLKILIIAVAVATVVRTTVAFQTLKVILIIQSMKVMAITRKLMTMVKCLYRFVDSTTITAVNSGEKYNTGESAPPVGTSTSQLPVPLTACEQASVCTHQHLFINTSFRTSKTFRKRKKESYAFIFLQYSF
jgi:hypothetical protein